MKLSARISILFVSLALCAGSVFPQERVFFGNLHSHTSYSDGSGTPREAFTYARDVAKLDFMALTEHNHREALGSDGIGIALNNALFNGSAAASLTSTARSMTVDGRFVALYGQEFSTISSGNHANVFEIGRVLDIEKGRFDLLLSFLGSNPDSMGLPAVVMLNHPYPGADLDPKEYGLDDFSGDAEPWLRALGRHACLIQMINGPGQKAGTNLNAARPNETAFRKFLNLGLKLAPTADQDNHKKNWGNATNARTAVVVVQPPDPNEPALTKTGILGALRSRHVYATEDKNLRVVIKVNGRLCGDVISPLPPAGELSISYSIADPDEPDADYEIEVWRDAVGDQPAKMVSAVTVSQGQGQIEDVAFSGEPQYFYFKIVIGISDRTNAEGARQLRGHLFEFGFASTFIDIRGLKSLHHLKSGLSYLGDGRLFAGGELPNLGILDEFEIIRAPRGEEYAANCVRVNDFLLTPAGCTQAHELLENLDYKLIKLEMSEFRKMDGGLSCLSIRF